MAFEIKHSAELHKESVSNYTVNLENTRQMVAHLLKIQAEAGKFSLTYDKLKNPIVLAELVDELNEKEYVVTIVNETTIKVEW